MRYGTLMQATALAGLAGLGATGVRAQTAPATSAAPVAAEEEGTVIIVTAQKREERLLDVPISVVALDGDRLDRSTSQGLAEELSRVPGVSINEGSGVGVQLTVRGVSAGNPVFAGSSTVGYYIDSSPFALTRTAIVPDTNVYDLERVEVLRGPQGTLYGVSALNGVVRILSHKADLDDFEVKGRVLLSQTKYSGEPNFRADTAINVPLVEGKLAARGTFGYQYLDGWIDKPNRDDRDVNSTSNKYGRFRVDAQPTPELTIGASVWISRKHEGGFPFANKERENFARLNEPTDTDVNNYALTAAYEFPFATLSSATSYLKYKMLNYADLRTAPPSIRRELKLTAGVFSQELTLSSASEGRFQWSLGGLYRDAYDIEHQFRANRIINGRLTPINTRGESKSIAVYGQATYGIIEDTLNLTAGLRFFRDKAVMKELTKSNGTDDPLQVRRTTFKKTTPRLALDWHFSKNAMAYVSYSEGFRSGVDQNPLVLNAIPSFPPAKSDLLRNYEIGTKGTALNRRVTFEGAIYYVDWEDAQQLLVVPQPNTNPPAFAAAIVNANSVKGPGIDLSLNVRATKGVDFGVGLGWNDLKIQNDVFSFGNLLYRKGDRPQYSPALTIAPYADFTFGLPHNLDGRLSVSANYTSEQEARALVNGQTVVNKSGTNFTGRGSFSVSPAGSDRWQVSLFVDNVTNNQNSPIPVFQETLTTELPRVRPRTFGIQFEGRY